MSEKLVFDVAEAMERVEIGAPVENEKLLVTPVDQKVLKAVTDRFNEYKTKYPERVDALDRKILEYYEANIETQEDLDKKTEVRDQLMKSVKKVFPGPSTLIVCGSTAQSLCVKKSDFDLCLCVLNDKGELDLVRDNTENILYQLHCELTANRPSMVCFDRFISAAAVPIVKVFLSADYNDMNIDIICNNTNVFYTNHLVQHYVMFDHRVRPLIVALKNWAKKNNVLDSMNGKLNSFSFVMMVIHYLQSVCSPPILPNLSKLFPSVFNVRPLKYFKMPHNHRYCVPGEFKSKMEPNHQTLGELFLGFLLYYSEFGWGQWAICVRLGGRFKRIRHLEDKKDISEMFIEEPTELFNTTRTVRHVFNRYDIEKGFQNLVSGIFTNNIILPENLVDLTA